MRKLIFGPLALIFFAACNTQPSAPLKTDMVILTPHKNIDVYTDVPTGQSAVTKKRSPISEIESNNLPAFSPKAQQEISAITHLPAKILIPQSTVSTPTTPAVLIDTTAINNSKPVATNINTGSAPKSVNVIPAENKKDTVINTTKPDIIEKDKGWTNATKGAVIGGFGGAIGGAILSKKKVQGAIIGGAIGAAGGYIFGKSKDDKEGKANYQFTQYR